MQIRFQYSHRYSPKSAIRLTRVASEKFDTSMTQLFGAIFPGTEGKVF